MPAPLPPLKKQDVPRLSFLPQHKPNAPVSSGGVPTDQFIIQLHAHFDPVMGDGEWRYIHFPQDIPFDEFPAFERFCRMHLPIQPDQFDSMMDYLHNYHVLNFDLRTGEMYPVVPNPKGFNVPIPLAGAPGPYLGGGNG